MNSSWDKYFWPSYGPFKKNKEPVKEALYFGVMCFLISFSLVTYLSKLNSINDILKKPFTNKSILSQKLEQLEGQNTVLESQLLLLNHQYSKMLEKNTEEYLFKYNSLLAQKETKGKGVIISINDSTKPLAIGENPNLMIVHNVDLLSIVNELWRSGAKAISINNKRITSTTEFNCIGSTIMINNSRTLPPYTINAIGNQNNLYNTVINGYISKYNLTKYGIKYSINKNDKITVPASSKTIISEK